MEPWRLCLNSYECEASDKVMGCSVRPQLFVKIATAQMLSFLTLVSNETNTLSLKIINILSVNELNYYLHKRIKRNDDLVYRGW